MTKAELPVLRGEIDLEMKRLGDVLAELESLRESVRDVPPNTVQLMAAAGFLHNFYNGIENCLIRIARGIDERVPTGPEFHREILDQMSADVSGIRPPVIESSLFASLDEYRRFRHAFRHMYFFSLRWDQMLPLVENARSTRSKLEKAIGRLFSTLNDPA